MSASKQANGRPTPSLSSEDRARAFWGKWDSSSLAKGRGKGAGHVRATVYGMVKQSGVFLAIRSAPGVGTRMMFCLPHVDDVATGRAAPTRPSAIGRGHENR